jgi:hypothetical protein
VLWLLGKLSPDHKTIARFRQNNGKALKKVFRNFVQLCVMLDLYGKELTALDGSKFKAVNSRKRNFTKKQIQDKIARIINNLKEHKNRYQGFAVKQIRIKPDKEILKQRKSIVEHPFGTVKRAMDAGYCLTKGLKNVSGEFALTFLAYNLKRAINILGCKQLIARLAQFTR